MSEHKSKLAHASPFKSKGTMSALASFNHQLDVIRMSVRNCLDPSDWHVGVSAGECLDC